ncbi:enth domain protein [Diplodia corticola]|uniref:Enth domain protein n=1 Tax=Diplodia corticola TaxID=236234 RepID=A0A1J9R9D7_9PEZI|nr:enth domain protein [Diplodia corticola]OJD36794.1 enth domain protein [Diplodia corticola]
MSSSFEKSVKGATKIKASRPLLLLARARAPMSREQPNEQPLTAPPPTARSPQEQNRLRDSTWTIVFKALIIIHLMIREGEPDVTLKYLAQAPSRRLAINNFTEVQTQGHNIRAYTEYIVTRAKSFGATRVDYVRSGEGRLKRLSVDKGLLRETEQVQDQIHALLQCDFLSAEPENEITLTAFRLLTMDILALFHVMNEGTINVLEHYFEMSHTDAERALRIYRMFCRQTDAVVQYLSIARLHEHSTRLEIPKVKHAPTSLGNSLEEYLNDKDFEINRRQYLAQQEAKRSGKANGSSKLPEKKDAARADTGFPEANLAQPESKGPAPDLIDFFESIEQNQQPMAQQAQGFQPPQIQFPQQTGMMPQQTGFDPNFQSNPFAQQQQPQQLQPNFTGAGFGGYGPQPPQQFGQQPQIPPVPPIPQNGPAPFLQPSFTGPASQGLQPQTTNPFRASMLMQSQPTGGNPFSAANNPNRASTNPFAKNSPQNTGGFAPSLPTIQSSQSVDFSQPPQTSHSPAPLQPAPTGTNPFARPQTAHAGASQPMLMPTATGSTNPFRQSAFVNQQTGQGWQNNQGTMGGLEQLETVSIFPRPGQPNGQQPQQTGWSS